MQSKPPDRDIYEHGGHVAMLVRGKGGSIASEFDQILANPGWLRCILNENPDCDESDFVHLAVLIVCTHAAGYRRRIVDALNTLEPYFRADTVVVYHVA